MKPQPMLSVSVKPWRHSDTPIWAPFSWTLRMSEFQVGGQSGTVVKEQGSHDMNSRLWGTAGLPKRLDASGPKGLEPIYHSVLFYRFHIFELCRTLERQFSSSSSIGVPSLSFTAMNIFMVVPILSILWHFQMFFPFLASDCVF
jgi:hypothetical protein